MKTSIPKTRLRRTIAILVVAFVLVVLALSWEVRALRKALLWVDRTDEVIGADRELVQLTIDTEAGLRGYLLTHDKSFLKHCEDALASIGPRFDALNRLVADNPGQQRKLAEIHGLNADWVRQSGLGDPGIPGTLEFFAEKSRPDAQLSLKAQMDRIRAEHWTFTVAEQKLRRQRVDTARSGEELIDALLLLICFLGGCAATLALKETGFLAAKAQSSVSPKQNPHKTETRAASWKDNWKHWMRSAALAIGTPSIAVLLSIPLRPYNPHPFVLFYAAVSIVAWVEGLWQGFFTLALSLALADYFLIPPYRSFAMGFNDALGLVLYACVQLLICWLIDSQKRAANELRDQTDLLDLSHDGIMVRDFDGTIRFWSHGAEEMYGFAAREACGRFAQDLLQTVFPQPLAKIDAELLQHNRWEGEMRHTTRGGAHIVVDSRWVLQEARRGTLPCVMEIDQDITERSLQEKLLRKNEAFLEQTGTMAGLGGWEIDLVTKELNWAAETYRIVRMDPSHRPTVEEALDLYTAESRPAMVAALEKAALDGKAWDLELGLNRLDGQRIWIRVVGDAEFANGKPVRLVGAMQDITDRVEERKALQEANLRATLATENCGIGIWDADLQSGSVHYDSFMYRLYGLEPDCGVQGDVEFWMGHVHPEDRPAVKQAFADGIAGIRPFDADFRIVWDDRSIRHIKASGKVIRDPDGNPVRIVGTNMDITAAKQAEQDLRESEEHFRAMVMATSNSVYRMSADWSVMNTLTGRDFLADTAEPDADWTRKYIHPDDREHVWAAIREAIRTKEIFELEHRVRTTDGSLGWTLSRAIPLLDANGGIVEWFGAASDITERKEAEEELVRKTQDLLRSNQELDQFAYAAAHDLKAPLRVIFNASKWLEEDLEKYLTPATREDMNLLRRRVVRMEKLLDDLLEYSGIGRKTSEGGVEILSSDKLMEDILGLRHCYQSIDTWPFQRAIKSRIECSSIFLHLL